MLDAKSISMRQRRSRGLTDVHPAQHSVAISAGGDIRKIVTTPDVVPGLPPRVESDAAVAIGRGIRNCRSRRGQSTCETLYILQPDRVKAGVIHPDMRNTRPPPTVAGAISEKGNATDLVFADIFTTVHAEPHSHLDLIPVGAPILDGAGVSIASWHRQWTGGAPVCLRNGSGFPEPRTSPGCGRRADRGGPTD